MNYPKNCCNARIARCRIGGVSDYQNWSDPEALVTPSQPTNAL